MGLFYFYPILFYFCRVLLQPGTLGFETYSQDGNTLFSQQFESESLFLSSGR